MTDAVQTAPETRPQSTRHQNGSVSTGIQWISSVIVIAIFVITFNLQAFEIPSDSMENTLLVGDYLLVDKVDYAQGGFWDPVLPYHKVQRGDIIVFRYPVHPQQHFVKRVIGVPGDRIHLSNKQVFVNGQPLSESYTVYHSSQPNYFRDDFPNTKYIDGNVESRWWLQMRKLIEDGNLIVPGGHYFVLGDNRDDSLDSRYWGFVPSENIVGRPLLIYWSVDRGDEAGTGDSDVNAKLTGLAYRLRNLFHDVRWDRTMKIVR
ncbi:MAG TPA: signal peptidase I [Terriglobales bacterium]|nr:signal peptidase I [Terriglobales bacterium]